MDKQNPPRREGGSHVLLDWRAEKLFDFPGAGVLSWGPGAARTRGVGNRLIGLSALGALLLASCGMPDAPPLKDGITVLGSDVRIGLTADDRVGEPARMKGSGFQRVAENSYVMSSAGKVGSGRLEDDENARAVGSPKSAWALHGEVFAEPSLTGARSDAQVVEFATSDLMVAGRLPQNRLVIETEFLAAIGKNAVVICKVEAELNYDGHLVGRAKGVYYLYGAGAGDQVAIYRGAPRGEPGAKRLAVVEAGESYVVSNPSFYFNLGPGQHEIEFSMSAQASSPLDSYAALGSLGGAASLEAGARLRIE